MLPDKCTNSSEVHTFDFSFLNISRISILCSLIFRICVLVYFIFKFKTVIEVGPLSPSLLFYFMVCCVTQNFVYWLIPYRMFFIRVFLFMENEQEWSNVKKLIYSHFTRQGFFSSICFYRFKLCKNRSASTSIYHFEPLGLFTFIVFL